MGDNAHPPINIDRQPEFGEWHVAQRPNDPSAPPDEQMWAIHYLLDPGDGLCSIAVDNLSKQMADHLVTLHNQWLLQ